MKNDYNWIYIIRVRDNYTCQLCGRHPIMTTHSRYYGDKISTSGVVHHIDRNTFNNTHENTIFLCRSCHTRVHLNNILSIPNRHLINQAKGQFFADFI